jgi:integrase
MAMKSKMFRVGRVSVYRRGRVWYLCYHQNGRRCRPRVGPDRHAARRLAAEINAQLENNAPAALTFEPIAIPDLRQRWLDHHEHVLRSSVATIRRYRAASDHLLAFVQGVEPVKTTSKFQARHAQAFATHLRTKQVAPNGHAHARRRPLRDKGVKYILEVCRALFNFAAKLRHLGPYASNPFSEIEIDRIPIEDAKPFVGLTAEQERGFLKLCDDWQFPIFVALVLTGVRPGELTHLLLPDDIDLTEGWLWVRNKPELGWQVKTRNERRIPLIAELAAVLRHVARGRNGGPVFLRRRFCDGDKPVLDGYSRAELQAELSRRWGEQEAARGRPLERAERLAVARTVWRDAGMVKTDRVRTEFMRLTRQIGLPEVTAPKTLRHMFATCLQDANVDPLIRSQLMGHTPAGVGSLKDGLGMTGVYTHTRPQTLRRQLEEALREHPAADAARQWLRATPRAHPRRQSA